MNTREVMELYQQYVMPTYTQLPICLIKGEGSFVWDLDGKKYLDFFPGWAVSGLGHRPKLVVRAIINQSKKLFHVSNNYMSMQQPLLAKAIIENSFYGKVFFANSGAEANEAAIKLARKYGEGKRYEIITMNKSFHGRTIATIAATGQDKVKKGFYPLPEGFKSVPFNNLSALNEAITDKTIAIMLELIQGEGGINIADASYIHALRKLCNEKNILLIFDEVQTGMGRTGKMFAFKHYGIEPDVMTLAKSLGGGVPIGCMVASAEIANVLDAGSHASTFGGSPLICAASLAVFETIEKDKLLDNCNNMGTYLMDRLNILKDKFDIITEVRGKGLMIGVELSINGTDIVNECLKRGLLINCTQQNILRMLPPLSIKKSHVNKAVSILTKSIKEVLKK